MLFFLSEIWSILVSFLAGDFKKETNINILTILIKAAKIEELKYLGFRLSDPAK